jgi:hypothetical protein
MSETITGGAAFVLPGLMPLKEFKQHVGNKCDRTIQRWRDAGKVVIVELGNERFVDLEATARRLRGEDRRNGRSRK